MIEFLFVRGSGFNGAAAEMPRSVAIRSGGRSAASRFNGAAAEMPRSEELPAWAKCQIQASMGPRLRCRGAADSTRTNRRRSSRFNWAAAEMPRSGSSC